MNKKPQKWRKDRAFQRCFRPRFTRPTLVYNFDFENNFVWGLLLHCNKSKFKFVKSNWSGETKTGTPFENISKLRVPVRIKLVRWNEEGNTFRKYIKVTRSKETLTSELLRCCLIAHSHHKIRDASKADRIKILNQPLVVTFSRKLLSLRSWHTTCPW